MMKLASQIKRRIDPRRPQERHRSPPLGNTRVRRSYAHRRSAQGNRANVTSEEIEEVNGWFRRWALLEFRILANETDDNSASRKAKESSFGRRRSN